MLMVVVIFIAGEFLLAVVHFDMYYSQA